MYNFFLQIISLEHVGPDQNSTCNSTINSTTLDLVLDKFSNICIRYTKLMAFKHHLQHHMFNKSNKTLVSNLAQAVMHLQTAAFRLQRIQVSVLLHNHKYSLYICSSKCRNYIAEMKVVLNLQQDSTDASMIINRNMV